MFITHKTFFPYATMVAVFFTACGASISSTEVTIPDEPSAAMQTIAAAEIAGNGGILRRAMPTRSQTGTNATARRADTRVGAGKDAKS